MFLDWLEPYWSFDRVTSNKKPYTIKKDEDKCVIIHEALGIPEEEIKVELTKEGANTYLTLKGSTKNKVTGDTYRFNSAFVVDENQIKSVYKTAKDGILYVVIEYKEPDKPQIEVKDIEDADSYLKTITFKK